MIAHHGRYIRQNAAKKEQTSSRRKAEFSLKCDFESLAMRAYAASLTAAGAKATFTATWKGPTLLGTTIYPEFTITAPVGRLDAWKGTTGGTRRRLAELFGEAEQSADW